MFSITLVKKNTFSKLLVGLSLTLLMSGKAEATTFRFKKVVDTNTAIPNGIGNFAELYNASLNHSVVTFDARGSNQTQGIYTYVDGSLTVVADASTPIPDTTNLDLFQGHSLDNGRVAFSGFSDRTNFSGVYINRDGLLEVIADTNTSIPNGIGNFTNFLGVSLSKREIVFRGRDNRGNFGIYTENGGILSVVADNNTTIPDGSGNFRFLYDPVIKNGKVAFYGNSNGSSSEGVYTYIDGLLNVVADTNTLVPGRTEKFSLFFSNVSIDSRGNVAFVGLSNPTSSTSFQGIYKKVGNSLNPVADTDTFVPSDPRNLKFCSFGNISLNNRGNVAFSGDICPRVGNLIEETGVYINIGGTLTKVLAKDDVLDGKIVSSSFLAPQALFGNKIVLTTNFSDKSQGIYVATVTSTSDDE